MITIDLNEYLPEYNQKIFISYKVSTFKPIDLKKFEFNSLEVNQFSILKN